MNTHTLGSMDDGRVKDAMHRGVLTCPLETPLKTVARMMATYRVHCVVVLGNSADSTSARIRGVVSDLDLVTAASGEDLEGRTAGGSAATDVVTIGPEESLRHAIQLMSEHRISHLVVVDPETDAPVGIISTLDIAAALAGVLRTGREQGGARVEQLMTRRVVTVPPEMPLKEVAALLVEHRISGVPVFRDGELVGVVSEGDILAKERGPAPPAADGLLSWLFIDSGEEIRSKLAARTAAEAMSSPVITIEPWRSASEAAARMFDLGVNRLPVLEKGDLVGIVSRADLVRAFMRGDAEIERDIREEVILHLFWISPGEIDVEVRDGEVTLTGTVETPLLAELLPPEVQRIPGVVSVRSELSARPEPADRHPLASLRSR